MKIIKPLKPPSCAPIEGMLWLVPEGTWYYTKEEWLFIPPYKAKFITITLKSDGKYCNIIEEDMNENSQE